MTDNHAGHTELRHPQRRLTLEGGDNVRDLGGYRNSDGHVTRWRRFVRSGDMAQLTPADQQALLDYGVRTVIDLRMGWEIAEQPNVFSRSDSVQFLVCDFWGDRFDDYRSPDRRAPPERKLADLYCAGLEASGFVMAEIVTTMADSTDSGFAFHCRSGKDRTGLVAALLLAVADVPEATICADFALTAECLDSEPVNPIDARQPGAWQRGCDPTTMARTLDFLTERWGGAVGYLRDIGVTDTQLARLREKLLEP